MNYFSVIVSCIFLYAIYLTDGQLTPSDPSIYDGPCNFPRDLALNTDVARIYNPLISYYVPLANKAFFRTQYGILHGQNATTQSELDSLKSRLHVLDIEALTLASDLKITFGGGTTEWYVYRCVPSNFLPLQLLNPLAPLLNLTCTVPASSEDGVSSNQIGTIYYSIIWTDSDSSAFTCWGCMNGRQIFHIMSTRPTLTEAQLSANEAILTPLGFNISNYQNMVHA